MQAVVATQAVAPGVVESQIVFPWTLVDQVFDLLEERKARCIRYCDVEAQTSWCGSRYRYLDEFVRFKYRRLGLVGTVRDLLSMGWSGWGSRSRVPASAQGRRTGRDGPPPTVILQHDADALPDRTLAMMHRERQRGLVSSSYFMVQTADGADSPLDVESLQWFEREGFEVGYHQNAYERSGYDLEQAMSLAERDIDWMRQYFNVRSFVPHGGTGSAGGLHNANLPHAGPLRPLLWAYNGKCILKDFTWSDGGIKKNTPIDPREFVRRLTPGSRVAMLLHPQYYGDTLRHDWERLPVARQKWWRELWGL